MNQKLYGLQLLSLTDGVEDRFVLQDARGALEQVLLHLLADDPIPLGGQDEHPREEIVAAEIQVLKADIAAPGEGGQILGLLGERFYLPVHLGRLIVKLAEAVVEGFHLFANLGEGAGVDHLYIVLRSGFPLLGDIAEDIVYEGRQLAYLLALVVDGGFIDGLQPLALLDMENADPVQGLQGLLCVIPQGDDPNPSHGLGGTEDSR